MWSSGVQDGGLAKTARHAGRECKYVICYSCVCSLSAVLRVIRQSRVNASARTSSGMDENEYRVREVTAQNERLLELLAQSEAEVAELQKRTASASSAASGLGVTPIVSVQLHL